MTKRTNTIANTIAKAPVSWKDQDFGIVRATRILVLLQCLFAAGAGAVVAAPDGLERIDEVRIDRG